MSTTLVIVGAGGHGRVVADIAHAMGKYNQILFLDDSVENNTVVGKVQNYINYLNTCDFFVAIGNNFARSRIFDELFFNGASMATLIHPSAVIGENVKIGCGTVVMPGAVINNGAIIGNGVIVNTSSSIDHDCFVENFVHISVGAHLAGSVKVGERSFICIGAVVINNKTITSDSIIGAGAVVVNDILSSGTYVGVPAKVITEKQV